MASETIFSKIIRREIPADIVYQDDQVTAFRDINPQMPVHILIIPKRNYENMLAISLEDSDFQRDLFATVQKLVQDFSLENGGYRLICNGGDYQTVPNLSDFKPDTTY